MKIMTVKEFSVFVLSTELLLACFAAITVSIICLKIWKQKSQPPCLGYWLPLIGCAVEYGKEPLYFVEMARRKVSYFMLGISVIANFL